MLGRAALDFVLRFVLARVMGASPVLKTVALRFELGLRAGSLQPKCCALVLVVSQTVEIVRNPEKGGAVDFVPHARNECSQLLGPLAIY